MTQEAKADPSLMEALGLSQDDVDEVLLERLEKLEEEERLQMYRDGNRKYNAFAHGRPFAEHTVVQIADLSMNTHSVTAREDLPNYLKKELDKLLKEKKASPEQENYIRNLGVAFLQGYGDAALTEGDWRTTLNTFDICTEGGIVQNDIAMGFFKKLSQENKSTGVKILFALQEKVAARRNSTPS